uniref:Uncharacterized protein n=1 Tax=Fusarium oxysporum (strain Fo5176) TaxID=660025 RepID=A0A0D2YDM4_FUSOF
MATMAPRMEDGDSSPREAAAIGSIMSEAVSIPRVQCLPPADYVAKPRSQSGANDSPNDKDGCHDGDVFCGQCNVGGTAEVEDEGWHSVDASDDRPVIPECEETQGKKESLEQSQVNIGNRRDMG